MNNEIIMSIKHEHLKNIINGSKKYELRKNVPKSYWIDIEEDHTDYFEVCFYDTTTKTIHVKAECELKIHNKKDILQKWEEWESLFMVSKEFFEEYYKNYTVVVLYKILDVDEVYPHELPKGKRPPQSWCYYDTIFWK